MQSIATDYRFHNEFDDDGCNRTIAVYILVTQLFPFVYNATICSFIPIYTHGINSICKRTLP
jgi:hypothetical protein